MTGDRPDTKLKNRAQQAKRQGAEKQRREDFYFLSLRPGVFALKHVFEGIN